ncbi:MAG TPA: hypothetical protein VMI93_08545 [Candidatus Solibacter sp.]|nr:hypothetical protein [Candidatus Solibacter sp.]
MPATLEDVVTITWKGTAEFVVTVTDKGDTRHVPTGSELIHASWTIPSKEFGAICKLNTALWPELTVSVVVPPAET